MLNSVVSYYRHRCGEAGVVSRESKEEWTSAFKMNNPPESNNSSLSGTSKRTRGIIYFRPIQPTDRQIIQRLHEQWFPVDYKSDFFDGLCNGRVMPGTSEPLYSCVACFKEIGYDEFEDAKEKQRGCISDTGLSFWFGRRRVNEYVHFDEYGECILWESDEHMSEYDAENGNAYHINGQAAHTGQVSSSSATDSAESYCQLTAEEIEREKVINFYNKINEGTNQTSAAAGPNEIYLNEEGERIVGCLIGSFLSSSRLSTKQEGEERDATAALLVPNPTEYPRMFYIMTLGTVPELRRCGLGSILVNRVADMIETRPECGALYLHVITYNKGAMKLYERLSFTKIKEIEDYYTINNVNYNCYLYARYFHGNCGHRSSFFGLLKYLITGY